VHNDLLSRNVLVNDGKISAILDWGNSLYGDHLYDAALLLYCGHGFQSGRTSIFARSLTTIGNAKGSVAGSEFSSTDVPVHIRLEHIAYTAFERRPDDLARTRSR